MAEWNGPQPAPRALWQLVHANFRRARNMGIFNRRNVAGTTTPSAHAEGRALDIGLLVSNPTEKAIGDGIFKALCDAGMAIGLDHVIWNRKIWSSTRGGPRDYTGVSPHTDHIHVAFTRDGSQRTSFPQLLVPFATLRTGVEDVGRATANIG